MQNELVAIEREKNAIGAFMVLLCSILRAIISSIALYLHLSRSAIISINFRIKRL